MISPGQRYAMRAMRFLHEHGLGREPLRAIALASSRHAPANPRAVMHGRPLAAEMYDASRWIVEPFRLYDCGLENDGAAALVLVPAERARDLRPPGVYLLGVAQGSEHRNDAPVHNAPLYGTSSFTTVAPHLYAMADVAPPEVDKPGLDLAERYAIVDSIMRGNDGGEGSPVYTHLERTSQPMIRLVAGDLARWTDAPCPCGRTYPRLSDGLCGRIDDMVIVRGENVYPGAIEGVLRSIEGFGGEVRVIVSRKEAMDELLVRAEYAASHAAPDRREARRAEMRERLCAQFARLLQQGAYAGVVRQLRAKLGKETLRFAKSERPAPAVVATPAEQRVAAVAPPEPVRPVAPSRRRGRPPVEPAAPGPPPPAVAAPVHESSALSILLGAILLGVAGASSATIVRRHASRRRTR